ncbi:MAG: cell envelope integrity EipB family protein [Dongiaceae bacterium]
MAVIICLFAQVGSAQAIEPAPHRAVYEMSLQSGSGRSEVSDVSGTMLYEWQDSCDGWSLTQRTAMRLLYATGDELDLGWNLVSWESKDGMRYRFFVRKLENGELTEEFRGEARLDGKGEGGTAEYSLPEKRTVKLPVGTLFPSHHTFALIERIEANERLFWATVFDGSDGEGLFDVNAVVANRLPAESETTGTREMLKEIPSSRVHLAFFDAKATATEPEHEQTLRLYYNGVVEDLVLDFGDFEVAAKLKELKKLAPPC